MSQQGEVVRPIVFTNAALVFVKGGVQGPVERVLDAPVTAANGLAPGFKLLSSTALFAVLVHLTAMKLSSS